MRAEAEERREEERFAFQPEAHRAERHDEDLGDLDDAGDERLVDAIGQCARCAREEKERRNEDRAGQHHQRGGVWPDWPARRNVTTMPIALFSRLSLKAPRNCVTNSGANRRAVKSWTRAIAWQIS